MPKVPAGQGNSNDSGTTEKQHLFYITSIYNVFQYKKFTPSVQILCYSLERSDTTFAVREGLRKYLNFIQPLIVRRSAIWVSDLKGHAHEVGRIEAPINQEAESRVDTGFIVSPTKIEKLTWLPPGKALSFQHDGSLYTVPVQ